MLEKLINFMFDKKQTVNNCITYKRNDVSEYEIAKIEKSNVDTEYANSRGKIYSALFNSCNQR